MNIYQEMFHFCENYFHKLVIHDFPTYFYLPLPVAIILLFPKQKIFYSLIISLISSMISFSEVELIMKWVGTRKLEDEGLSLSVEGTHVGILNIPVEWLH